MDGLKPKKEWWTEVQGTEGDSRSFKETWDSSRSEVGGSDYDLAWSRDDGQRKAGTWYERSKETAEREDDVLAMSENPRTR